MQKEFLKACLKTWCLHQNWNPPEGVDVARAHRIINSVMGLAGECGEVVEPIKKWFYHGKPLDKEKLKLEFGDILFYINVLSHELGIDLEECQELVTKKLEARYGKSNNNNP